MRYLPLDASEREAMLPRSGFRIVEALFADIPADKRFWVFSICRCAKSEMAVERAMDGDRRSQVSRLDRLPFFCGAGAYRHHVPASVDHIIQRSEFLTSYTPYQPEIAQGTLQVLFEFQTQVAALTGLEVANASMYDGSTACAEAVMMAQRVNRRKKAILSGGVHPHYAATTQTIAHAEGMTIVRQPAAVDAEAAVIDAIDAETACVVVQTPNVFGVVTDVTKIAEAAHAAGALLIVVTTEAVSSASLKSPGEMGADIAVAEGQSIGNALNYGGPYVGLFACREKLVRQMPGRLCGETVDAEGRRGYVLTLSTREQHIRREKATSNICTNSGLCALAFTIHLSLLGETGLRQLAALNHSRARELKTALGAVPGRRDPDAAVLQRDRRPRARRRGRAGRGLLADGVVAGVPYSRLDPHAGLDDVLLLAATETTTAEDICRPDCRPEGEDRPMSMSSVGRPTQPTAAIAEGFQSLTGGRGLLQDEPLLFETRRLGQDRRRPAGARARRLGPRRPGPHRADRPRRPLRARDAAPLRAPLPEEPRHRPGALSAGLVHDEAQPAPQREDGPPGRLRRPPPAAAAVDGPGRAGADGPPGPLAEDPDRHARRRHVAQGRRPRRALRPAGHQGRPRGRRPRPPPHRAGARPPPTAPTPPPPPSSATPCRRSPRPTTAASTSPTCEAKLGPDVAAIMVTNPNTCGLFERDIIEIARVAHAAGAYFYCDGANFNAIVGRVRPGDLGVDAMHINLHKTFSTPHGGGGPGAGPVVLSAALAALRARPLGRPRRATACAWSRKPRTRPPRPSAACAPSRARWACSCAPTPTCEATAPTACARSPRTRCSTPTTSRPACRA